MEQEHVSTDEYLKEFWTRVPQANTIYASANITPRSIIKIRALYCDSEGQRKYFGPLEVSSVAQSNVEGDASVIIVENISSNWIALLGTTFGIDVNFFCEHIQTPTGPTPWEAVFSSSQNDTMDRGYWHVDGVFELGDQERSQPYPFQSQNFARRRLDYHAPYGWEVTTRISYCQLKENLFLFLVDAPVELFLNKKQSFRLMTTLHFPVSTSRGGLVLPQLLDRSYQSLFETLEQFFTHQWHFHHLALSSTMMLYFVVASTWTANLRYLDHQIKRISFEDIRRPSIHINNKLHDCRQALATLHSEILMVRKYIPPLVTNELERIKNERGSVHFPDKSFDETLAQSEILEKLLMDTFQLLMSSITVLDSETSIQQARSGQKLALLATVYVPLSFVTGIFGMNIKEINGSVVPWWVCVVTLLVIIACTAGIISAYSTWEERVQEKKGKATEGSR